MITKEREGRSAGTGRRYLERQLGRTCPCPPQCGQDAFVPPRSPLDAARVPDGCDLCCHELCRDQLLVRPARAPSNRCSRRLPTSNNGRDCRASQPSAGCCHTHDVPISWIGRSEMLDQSPERNEFGSRHTNIAARNTVDEPICHLHASHCHAAYRQLATEQEAAGDELALTGRDAGLVQGQ